MAPSDEAFWREQEERHQNLEQPCCTQSNMCGALVDMPGDFAVVVHGEADCLHSFFHHLGGNTASYYGSRVTERQLIAGDTHQPLQQLLRCIAEERRPEAVFVLGTCSVEMIGDPFEAVVAEVAAETGIPMRALRTHGLALMSQAKCQDWLHSELAALEPIGGTGERALNIIGLPRASEYVEAEELLSAVGLRVNGFYPGGCSLRQWRSVANADASFVVDQAMFPKLTGRLNGYRQQVVEVPLPVGVEPTADFYRAIAATFDVGDAMASVLEPRLAACRAEVAELAEQVRGRRLAMCVRMLKTHRTDRLVYDGLGELPLLESLGFDIGILVQGPPEAPVRARFAERLRALGYGHVPFDVFEGPWRLGERLADAGYDVALMSDVARNVVEKAGVQMLSAGSFRPLLSGMPANLELVARAVDMLP